MKILNLKDPVYDFKLNLVVECDYDEFRKLVLDNDQYDCGDFADETVGMYVPIEDKNVYYMYIRDMDIPIIAHEILHMVFDMLTSKGLSLSDSSEEAYTYSFEYWMRLILTKIMPNIVSQKMSRPVKPILYGDISDLSCTNNSAYKHSSTYCPDSLIYSGSAHCLY